MVAILSPFFLLSAILSYHLSKAIAKQEKEIKRRKKRAAAGKAKAE